MNIERELLGKKIRVWDAECKNQVDGQSVTWKDYHLMGIASIVVYDYEDGRYKVFMDDNLGECVELLNSSKLVVGFNNIGFDHPLLREFRPEFKDDGQLNIYDIYSQSREAVGAFPDERPPGLSLNEHLKSIGLSKTGQGAMAPILYQQQKYGELISYNIADVFGTKALFESIWDSGTITTPTYGKKDVLHPIHYYGQKL